MTRFIDETTLDYLVEVVRDNEPDNDRYRIHEEIGRGGMGTVYLAEDRALGRHVAMKVLRGDAPNSDAVDRMLQEARVIAQLEHPGIVPVHDSGRLPDGRVYYIMKLVKGRRLDEYTDSGSLMQEHLRVFERICETMAFAHASGVIHRDLKPQNVMVGEFGEVLVLDWGVAKTLRLSQVQAKQNTEPGMTHTTRIELDARQTADGTILGTPAYMAPEQSRGDVTHIDERSDVFGLGGILYFMLTRTPPRTDASSVNGAEEALVPPRQTNRAIPRRLQSICLKALSREPAERYNSAAEFVADIGRFLNGQAVLAHKEGILERLARWAWWYRVPILIVGTYVVMRALLAIWQRN